MTKPPTLPVENLIPIVGIGSSAGGLEALSKLISGLDADTGLAFVVVQHLKSDQESHLPEILGRCTSMPVRTIENGMQAEANVIYVVPPGFDAALSGTFLNLNPRGESAVHRLGIDFFFSSLSQSQKSKAIGIILSGSGSDGTIGLKAIKSEGGISIVQDPQTARFDGMPRSAIASGIADLILAPESIARELKRLAHHPYTRATLDPTGAGAAADAEHPALSTNEHSWISKILDVLLSQTKIDFSQYKMSTIKRRIERQMMLRKFETIEKYADYLLKDADEVKALYEDIFIHVTDFFRDPDAYQALGQQVFPQIVKGKDADTPIRIWVPGCATGEEAYSLAIVLTEFLDSQSLSIPFNIFAGDISEPALTKARKGVYSEYQLSQISPERLERFFEKIKGGYKIRKSLRDVCIFSRHDVTSNPPIPRVDLISCRNVLIYFSSELQKRVFPVFHYALNPNGYLWLGRAESPDTNSKLFNSIDKSHRIFRKVQGFLPPQPRFSTSSYSSANLDHPLRTDLPPKAIESVHSADQVILFRYSPASVVVDRNFDILQFRGRTAPYIDPAPGIASYNLLKMVHPDLLVHLRACLQSVRQNGMPCRKEELSAETEGKQRPVTLDVSLLNPMAPPKERQYLVIFEDGSVIKPAKKPAKSSAPAKRKKAEPDQVESLSQQNTQLIQELEAVREYQQSLVEEYEAAQEELTSANEELRSTNEELQSTNEELHSTNEELGTAKEELQATNEEVQSTNEELQKRNVELETALRDLEHSEQRFKMMVENVKDYAIFMLDPEGYVSTWNEGAKRINGYPAHEIIGQHFSRFYTHEDLARDHPKEELRLALLHGKYEEEGWRVRKDGTRFWSNVVITPLMDGQGHLRGYSKVTRDLTERKRAEEARLEEQKRAAKLEQVKKSEETLVSVFDRSPSFMAITVGKDHVFERANRMYYDALQVTSAILGKRVIDVFPEIEVQGFIARLDEAFRTGKPFVATEAPLKLLTSDGGERLLFVDFVYQPLLNAEGKVYGLVHQGYDVTEKVLSRKSVENERANFRNLFKQTPEMVCILSGPEHVFEFVNEAHVHALGFDATGMSVRKAQPESVEVHGILDEVYRTGKTAFLHEIPVTLTDRLRYFNLTYSARRDDAGRINGIMILGVEVTDQVLSRKRIEEYANELETSRKQVLDERERFSRVAGATSLGVWYCDLPFSDLVWNEKTKEHFWMPADAHVTIDTFYERIHPDDRERTRNAIEHSIQSRSAYNIEYRTIDPYAPNRKVKWVHAVGWADYDPQGKPIRFDGITLDVTGYKEAIEDQKKSLGVLEILNQVGSSISAELELNRLVQSVTDAATKLSGAEFGAFFYNVLNEKGESYTLYSLSGAPREAFDKFPMPRNTQVFAPTFHGTGVVRSDDITKDPRYGKNAPHYGKPKGHLPVVSYLAVPVISRSGEVLGGLFFGHSKAGAFTAREEELIKGLAAQASIAIDNARLYQQLKEAVRVRDQFLSIASHELRTPLTGMKIQTQMFNRVLARSPNEAMEGARVSKLVRQIDGGLNRLVRLVDDMLDISRIQIGKLSLQTESCDLVGLVNETLDRLKPELANAGIELKVSTPRELAANIDRFRIEQVITNLITNAIRYAPRTPLDVTLEKVGDRALLRFKDHGPGINKADQEKVFKRFERLVSPNQVSGMGLGLFISKEIVEGHGGTIRIESGDHQGACFVIELPLEKGTVE